MGLNGPIMMLKELLTICVCCAAVTLAAPFTLRAENKIPEDCKTGGFFIGCQAYTFNHFSVFEAIEKTADAGGKVIEFYPGQKLSKEEPNVKWDHNASAETIQKVKDKLAACKVTAVNYGVVGIPKDEAEARKLFEFAKTMGLYAITTESGDALDTIEKLVKEYDIRVAFITIRSSPRTLITRCGTPNTCCRWSKAATRASGVVPTRATGSAPASSRWNACESSRGGLSAAISRI